MTANGYAVCPACGFGVEGLPGQFCYNCKTGSKPRGVPALKRLLAESEVLALSAKRIDDTAAVEFYTAQVARCRQALDANEGQGDLFK